LWFGGGGGVGGARGGAGRGGVVGGGPPATARGGGGGPSHEILICFVKRVRNGKYAAKHFFSDKTVKVCNLTLCKAKHFEKLLL
jgi:hypothetical protein